MFISFPYLWEAGDKEDKTMNVRNCRKCGKIFNYVSGPHICPSCREALEEVFQRVKEYIREHNGASINEVAENCEVEVSQIQQWLREERLELAPGSAITLECETCGAPITCGRYCEKCRKDLASDLNGMVQASRKPEPVREKRNRDGDKMRFLNH